MDANTSADTTIGDYFEDCRALSAEDFEAKHGRAFLIHHGPIGELRRPVGEDHTLPVDAPDWSGGGLVPKRDFLVFQADPPAAARSGEDMIWVGRGDNNEVIIPDVSVSEVHAFILYEGGGFFIQDAGSRNGTSVNNVQVLPQGMGKPCALPTGARVRFGAVKMTFLLAKPFRTLVTNLLG